MHCSQYPVRSEEAISKLWYGLMAILKEFWCQRGTLALLIFLLPFFPFLPFPFFPFFPFPLFASLFAFLGRILCRSLLFFVVIVVGSHRSHRGHWSYNSTARIPIR
jgi:hypothetical protein